MNSDTKWFIYPNEDPQIGFVELVDQMGDRLSIVNAARVSYAKESREFGDKDNKLLQYLIANGHMSPFEHVVFTFRFKVPIFTARQHMRYRTWSLNEQSGRFLKETEETVAFYNPTYFRSQSTEDKQQSNDDQINPLVYSLVLAKYCTASGAVEALSGHCFRMYSQLIDAGIAREQARMVLPLSKYTEYIGTIDLRNLYHFIEERSTDHAQWEIRQVAMTLKSYLISQDLWFW
jgi:thymidylate synthase (FAD)